MGYSKRITKQERKQIVAARREKRRVLMDKQFSVQDSARFVRAVGRVGK